MSNPQRLILIVAALVVAMMLLYPPFQFVVSNGAAIGAGYNWILSPPRRGSYGPPATVDVAMLLVQWLGAVTIAGLAYLIVGERSRSRDLPDVARCALPASSRKAKEGVRAAARDRSESRDRQTTDNESFWLHLGLIAVVVLILLVAYAGVVTYASGVSGHAGAGFFLTKLASSALTWAIGLSPAIVIRRVYGAPLTKGAAFGVAALVWGALSYLLFLSTAGYTESRLMYGWTGVGIMAALNFYILILKPHGAEAKESLPAADSASSQSEEFEQVPVPDGAQSDPRRQRRRNNQMNNIAAALAATFAGLIIICIANDDPDTSASSGPRTSVASPPIPRGQPTVVVPTSTSRQNQLNWKDFSGSAYFQGLSAQDQRAARQRFFDDRVAPLFSPADRAAALAEFYRRTESSMKPRGTR